MECEILLNATDVSNFLQITVEFLIGDDGHELTIDIFALILFQYFDCRRKQGNSYLCVGFLTVGDYPQSPVKHLLDVVNTQVGEVDVCQSGEATENYQCNQKKNTANKRQFVIKQQICIDLRSRENSKNRWNNEPVQLPSHYLFSIHSDAVNQGLSCL